MDNTGSATPLAIFRLTGAIPTLTLYNADRRDPIRPEEGAP